jgi:flagellar hook-associated protein 2
LSSSSIPGTNVPPVSFPGIVSGINYDAIIQKLTSLTLSPTTQLNHQLASLNAANAELIKINNLFQCVQSALGELSDPSLFESWDAVSSNTTVATATGIPSATAVAGTYTINCATVATATSVLSSLTAGHNINDVITSGTYAGQASNTVPLIDSYAAITPTNGNNGQGVITVDGQQIKYNVNVQSLNSVLASINAAVDANYDSAFNISDVGGTIQITGSKPITLGSSTDSGDLLQVLKLDQAQINNSGAGPYTVTGTSGVGGLNQAAPLDSGDDSGFVTPVTSGTFTINGVSITVSASGDNLASILAKINSSAAGVDASYNAATNEISLTSTSTGPQSIVLSAPPPAAGGSNFLSAAGLTTASGATTSIGKQAYVQVQNPDGSTSNIYSSSNSITSAIPGISLNLTSSSSVPFTVTVSQDTNTAVNAINGFISAYNAAISEINNATAAPIVGQATAGSGGAAASVGGGVLWGNADVTTIKNELTDMVSGFFGSGSSYNSLAAIGVSFGDSFTVLTTGNNDGSNGSGSNGGTNGTSNSGTSSSGVQQTTYEGTDGTFNALNTTTFLNALAANPSAVENVLQGANGLANQLGSYLTGVTGFPTLLNSGPVGNVPTTSVMSGFEESNTDNITNVQQQIAQITNNANMQANQLRAEFVNTETQLAEFQALQSQLSSFFKSSGS